MESEKVLLEFITRLAYNIDGMSGDLKLYFSEFLSFHFSKTLSSSQILDIENRRSSTPFASNEEIVILGSTISLEGLVWSVGALRLLQSQAEKADDRILSRKIRKVCLTLISLFNLESEEAKIEERAHNILIELNAFQNRRVIKIPAHIWPLTLDFLIRWGLLIVLSAQGLLDGSAVYVFNFLLVPCVILTIVYFVGRKHKKINKALLDFYGGSELYKVEYRVSTTQLSWLALFLGTGTFVSYLLPDQLHAITFLGLAFYYFLYFRFFLIGKIEENDLVKQVEAKNINTSTLSVDENDEVIVQLETNLNSYTSRLEAYVLESALFGALTFSGFLQIMATDLVEFKDLENFAGFIFNTSSAFLHFDWDNFYKGINGLSSKVNLFCLVSLESLICSIFFLAVIAARLRFSDIADRVRKAINMARTYNAKEEVLLEEMEMTEKRSGRLQILTTKVNEQLHVAAISLEEVNPVVGYMEYFRNAGILVFLVILISSSLFITSALGWTFLALVFATYFYFNRTPINNFLKSVFLDFRIQFIKQAYWFALAAISPFILAFTLKVFLHVSSTDLLVALGYSLMSFYAFTWLLFAAHVDEKFGEIENTAEKSQRESRWKLVKWCMAFLILLMGLSLAIKELHFHGANATALISYSAFGILMFFVGYYLSKVRWLGIVCGICLLLLSFGIVFRVLHIPSAALLFIGFCSSIIFFGLVVWKKEMFHSLLVKIFFCGFLFTIITMGEFGPITWYSLAGRFSLIYEHQTFDIKPMMDATDETNSQLFLDNRSMVDKSIDKSEAYINRFGANYGYTGVYRTYIREYTDYGYNALGNHVKDTAMLQTALKLVHQANKIQMLFNYEHGYDEDLTIESEILIALNRKEEAIENLKSILKVNPPAEFQKAVKERLIVLTK